jgi:AcrR family transcriptional regulator
MTADKNTTAHLVQGTKWRIIVAAVELFATKGYPGASMRDLAKAVGIKPASIYSHFESKQALLYAAYDVYEYHLARSLPDIDELLADAEVDDPRSVLKKSAYYFDPRIQEFMNQTVAVAVCEERRDERSSEFVNRVLLEIPGTIVRLLVGRLLELGRIKPLDVEGLVIVFTNYCYSAAIRDGGRSPISVENWNRGFALLTSVIQPTASAAAGEKAGAEKA